MWNNNIIHNENNQDILVVANASYPGKVMYKAEGLSTDTTKTTVISNGEINGDLTANRVNAVYFDERYSHAVFCSDNYNVDKTPNLQISDAVFTATQRTNYGLFITNDKVYFDMTSKKWVTDVDDICTIDSGYYNHVDDATGEKYYYSANDSNIAYSAQTLDNSNNKYWFCVTDGTDYWKYKNSNNSASNYDYHEGATGTQIPLTTSGYSERIKIHNQGYNNVPQTGVYTFKFDKTDSTEPKITVYFPSDDPNN